MLVSIEEAVVAGGVGNVRPIRATPEKTPLPERVDLVFLCNVYHHLPDQDAFFRRLGGQLAPNARVAIVQALPGGIAARLFGHVTPPGRIRSDMEAAGYRLEASHDLLAGKARQSFQVFVRSEAGPLSST